MGEDRVTDPTRLAADQFICGRLLYYLAHYQRMPTLIRASEEVWECLMSGVEESNVPDPRSKHTFLKIRLIVDNEVPPGLVVLEDLH